MPKAQEISINYKTQYYLFQFLGWGLLIGLIAFFNIKEAGWSISFALFLAIIFTGNFLMSHFYRVFVSKYEWMESKIESLLIKIILASFILGILFSVIVNASAFVISEENHSLIELGDVVFGSVVYFIWSILYVGYLFFYKARREEYKNMQLSTLSTEAELKNLKSQLNPHFMFNAMNSIRALIDEDPSKSKEAVTQLSNVLRNSLILSKKKKITLAEEMSVVNDYLSLEKIRYEERLQVELNIANETLGWQVPPMLIQTLVENAIKHGVSKLIKGGLIQITSEIENEKLKVIISNTGSLSQDYSSDTAIGIENTQKRLKLLYGNKSSFGLRQKEENVIAELIIPKSN